jgi:hypothetical protein
MKELWLDRKSQTYLQQELAQYTLSDTNPTRTDKKCGPEMVTPAWVEEEDGHATDGPSYSSQSYKCPHHAVMTPFSN